MSASLFPRVVIVADDLSSATDCGVQMARAGLRVVVPLRAPPAPDADVDVLSLDADSRHLDAAAAGAATRAALGSARPGPASAIYKSLDSTLRGNPGAEIEALLEAGEFDLAAIAPAFPTWGRTTLGGVQRVHGTPVHETEFGTDPRAPVRTSSIAERLAAQCARRAVLMPLEVSRAGRYVVERAVDAGFGRGATLFIFDALEEADLDRIADAVAALPARVLWAGSTGLARAVPPALGLRPAAPRVLAPVASGCVLIVAGSASATTRRQLDACVAAGALVEVRMDAVAIARGDGVAAGEIARVRDRLVAAARGAPAVALTLTASRADVEATRAAAASRGIGPEAISATLVRALAARVVGLGPARIPLRGLVLTGGDTARTVLGALAPEAVEIVGEVEPGIPLGRVPARPGMLVVTKAGGFGTKQALRSALRLIEDYRAG